MATPTLVTRNGRAPITGTSYISGTGQSAINSPHLRALTARSTATAGTGGIKGVPLTTQGAAFLANKLPNQPSNGRGTAPLGVYTKAGQTR